MFKTIKKALFLLEKKELKLFIFLLFLMLVAMVLETISLGSLIPIINYFTDSDLLPGINSKIGLFLANYQIPRENLLVGLLIVVLLIFVVKNLFLLLFHWIETKIIVFFRAKISLRLFKKYLNEDYKFHLEKNSYEISSNILQETAIFGAFFLYLSLLLTEIFLVLGLILLIYILNPFITSMLLLAIILLGSVFHKIFKKKIKLLGIDRKAKERDKQNILQQGLSSLKEIIIFKAQNFFIKKYDNETTNVAQIHHKFAFISKLPKLWFETFAIFLIVALIFSNNFFGLKEKELLAYLSVGILALIKLLPSTTKIINAVQYINFSKQAVDNLYSELNKKSGKNYELKTTELISFKESIMLNNLNYQIPNSNISLLKNLNLKIKKNQKVGIMGETGSGKSTLINIIAGLVKPTSGEVKIDNLNLEKIKDSWLNKIGYVSQSVSLFEGTIANNIAFGAENDSIDDSTLNRVIELADLGDFISKQSNGFHTQIKENGKNLSGGEKQRISIARALYKNPEVIIFDESTSSLDLDTEKKIISSIERISNKRTIIFVSHKKTALEFCNIIYQIKNKKLEQIV